MAVQTKRGGATGVWARWVIANSLAETVGLGSALGIGVVLFPYLQAPGVLAALTTAAAAILAGTLIEGAVVGTAQWFVLRRPLPDIRWRSWALATAVGAFIAWTAGMLPVTLLGADTEAGAGGAAEPSAAAVYGLAAAMGLLAGTILGTPQWLVLRRHVPRAALWIPANALAWAPGMVMAFVAADFLFSGSPGATIVLLAIATLAAIGAVVGAIHGLALVWLLRLARPLGPPVSLSAG
ncbi:hypothetical protein GBA63_20155 [Rubrobacter tropicus]|uniref:Uncharacterized protein n=1 Tax=Rubrobacter tropicus TaxID=2653851 RepID=A0A6G8QDX0_9ACTN|nr:hypothetical protein [Rubrobacter tropicus]QIN84704.1 hypothetical protein GBA63_20155 [Rubrobacter tropicus]